MTPERWEQIRDVLEKALELAPAPGERSAFLNRARSSDQSLRQEVETLLDSVLTCAPPFCNHIRRESRSRRAPGSASMK